MAVGVSSQMQVRSSERQPNCGCGHECLRRLGYLGAPNVNV